MALSPPYRATPPPEDVSVFDGGEGTPTRTYLLAGRLFAGGLSGSALILLAISSFAVGIGGRSLFSHNASPAPPVQVAPPKQTSAAAQGTDKLAGTRSATRTRAHGHRSRPKHAVQSETSARPTAPAEKNPSTPSPLATSVHARSPVEALVAASTQEPPATDPATIELPGSNVVDTLVSTVPALPALPALPPPAASVVTTATTLVGTP